MLHDHENMKISIEALTFETLIGVLERERLSKQLIEIDMDIMYEYEEGIYIDYALICDNLQEWFEKEKFGLLEDALLFCTQELKQLYPHITQINMKITKPYIMENARVGVTISKNY